MKKKVSFDIDEEVLSDLKGYCQATGLKLSDFFRQAVDLYLEHKSENMFIYVSSNFQLQKFYINPAEYMINYMSVEDDLKDFFSKSGMILDEKMGKNKELNQLLEERKVVKFWAK